MSDIAVKVSAPIALRARLNEDWLAVVIGLLVFGSALISISGTDLLGWAVTTSVYTDLAQAHKLALVPFLLDRVALNPVLMQADGLHANEAGQPLLLDNVWPKLEPLLRAIRH